MRVCKAALATLTVLVAAAAAPVAPASAAFGLSGYDVTFTDANGDTVTQAGSHPFAMTTSFRVNSHETGPGEALPDDEMRNLIAEQVAGFVADTTAYPTCSTLQFLEGQGQDTKCPAVSAVGVTGNAVSVPISRHPNEWVGSPVYNLTPPPGSLLRLGFSTIQFRVTIDVGIEPEQPYAGVASLRNVPQIAYVYGSKFQLWGDPSDSRHDAYRGNCYAQIEELEAGEEFEFKPSPACESSSSSSVQPNERPFLTLPASCAGPLLSSYEALSWHGAFDSGSVLTHDAFGNPSGFTGCENVNFKPVISSRPTTDRAVSGSGLDFSIDFSDEGLTSVSGTAQSQIEKAVTVLPPGVTANPSLAEGIGVCTEGDLEAETLAAAPGEGCPEASELGSVSVESPLVASPVPGTLYLAKPYVNPFGSLIALYIVLEDPQLGLLVKLPLEVKPNPRTGQLETIAEDIPQLPFSHFELHFREGQRAPLITPPGCGTYTTTARLTPWARPGETVERTATFQIQRGFDGSSCPSGTAPFHPGFEAGTLNNAAGAYSPFLMRITRADGEQDLTKLSQVLPRGVVGRIAGIPYCPEAGIAQALGRSGEHGGEAERADPSCPLASRLGSTMAGAGVGSELTYVPGRLYLAGPYHGDPLSIVSITPAVAGPFDAGTVVVRFALTLDPVSAEVHVDGSASDPIPHILQGIPLNVRDLQVRVDRSEFTLNATSCAEEQTKATLFGGGTVLDPLPDHPVDTSARYQAAGCRALGFAPKLGIKLKGGTRRGAHPALRAVVTPRPGDANFSRAVVTLPHSAFLEQAHIRTVCTRVQFAAGPGNGARCPKGSVYGHARAWSPLLAEPLAGPVFLRSSSHKLPDLLLALHGLFDIDLSARIDSVHGGIRTSFTAIPDAPVSRFILDMQGAKKGLIVNSRNLCFKPKRNRARANLTAQSGKQSKARPVVRALRCAKHRKRHRGHRRRRGHHGG